jgi:hypothetical protein
MAFEISIEADTRLTRARFVEPVEAYGAEPKDRGEDVLVLIVGAGTGAVGHDRIAKRP